MSVLALAAAVRLGACELTPVVIIKEMRQVTPSDKVGVQDLTQLNNVAVRHTYYTQRHSSENGRTVTGPYFCACSMISSALPTRTSL